MVSSASLLALSAAALVSGAAVPRDSNPGCTANSMGNFDWTVTGFQYNASYIFSTPAHQIDDGEVAFSVANPALSYPADCKASSTQLEDFFYGNIIYTCTGAGPENETTTTFTFSYPAQQLQINQTWICSDQDPQYPDEFTYYGAANLTLDCTTSDYQNPNWTEGEIYSSRQVACTSAPITIAPYLETAAA